MINVGIYRMMKSQRLNFEERAGIAGCGMLAWEANEDHCNNSSLSPTPSMPQLTLK